MSIFKEKVLLNLTSKQRVNLIKHYEKYEYQSNSMFTRELLNFIQKVIRNKPLNYGDIVEMLNKAEDENIHSYLDLKTYSSDTDRADEFGGIILNNPDLQDYFKRYFIEKVVVGNYE